ncbi:MAG: choice-of-anchor J domain-containing protein, partial [Candidatus Cloacimonetes bacterium]|nr:choice-of-anchor J domain-containing protein [Candidatus Cloacimonadota bacterium]
MKRKIFVLVLLLSFLATLSFAQMSLFQGFEGATFPPVGWTPVAPNWGTDPGGNWTTSGFVQATAPNSGIYSSGSSVENQWITTPAIQYPSTITYFHRKATGNTMFALQVSTNGVDFTSLPGYPIFAGNGWSSQTTDLSGYSSQTIYLRWRHIQNDNQMYIDDITLTTAAAPSPIINVTTNTLTNFGLVPVGNYSTSQSYTVSASNLSADLVITAPANYEIDTVARTRYSGSITLTPVGGSVPATPIYVRFVPSTTGVLSGNIVNSSTGASPQNVAVTGTGIDKPVITDPTYASITSVSAILGGNVTNVNYSNVTERGIYYSTTNGFADGTGTKVSETGSFGTGIFAVGVSGLMQSTTYYYKAFATNAAGTSYTVQDVFYTPGITLTGTLNNFGNVKVGNVSAEQSYTVEAVNLTNNLVITAPAGYQVSTTSGAGFSPTVVLTPGGGGIVPATPIYVRFAPVAVGPNTANITHTSTSTTTQNMAVSGTGINNPVITTPTSAAITSVSATLGGNITNINFSNVTERGIYYSTTNGFADGDGTKVSVTGSFGTGTFTVSTAGLLPGTTYYFKAFATNAAGTSYTTQASFATPGITVTGALVDFGPVKVGNYSAEQTYSVSAVNLTGNLVIIAPTGFQISLTSGAGFANTLNIAPVGGTVAATTIYVRFAPVATGDVSSVIANTSASTNSVELPVHGLGINPPVVINPNASSLTSATAVLGATISNVNYSNVSERGFYYSTTDGFADGTGTKVSELGVYGTGPYALDIGGLSQAVTYYFKAFATNAAGTTYTAQASFITPAAFGPSDITVVATNTNTMGVVVIGSVLTITIHDGYNQTPSAFQTVTCDLTQFGGQDNYPTVKTTNLPNNGIYTAVYEVQPGNIEAFNSKVSVTVSNYGTVEDEEPFAVNNYLDVPDILDAYLQVNNDPNAITAKIGDIIHVKATLKPYVARVWINWGHTFPGAPILDYPVIAGQLDATYTPAAGMIAFNPNLTIRMSKMQSTNGYYTFSARILPFYYDVSGNMAGDPITIDLVIPDITGGLDLFYNTSVPLRFSPFVAGIDGYTTLPNTFAIRFYIPEWDAPGGTSQITLRFVAEDRNVFYKTFSGTDVETVEDETRAVYQQIIWDGRDDLGNLVSPDVSTTYGITIWELKDGVGNNAVLTHSLGNEYSPTGVENPATHHDISSGDTYLNRIHVVADGLLPLYTQNLTITNAEDTHLVRIINDANYNSQYDPGETVIYTDLIDTPNNTIVSMNFRVRREYMVDTNPLCHESVKYWVELEQTGTANKWYYNGANWVSLAGFDQYTDALSITFPPAATNSNVISLNWDTSNLLTFPGSDPGITYKLYAYIQDNAGNIVKSQERNIILENRYIQLPIITEINIIPPLHPVGPGFLPQTVLGNNAYYLTSAYGPGDAPYTGNYYVTTDQIHVEFVVNNRTLLRDNQSVFVDMPTGFGIADFYINKTDFDPVTYKYVKVFNVADINNSAGALSPGTYYTISGNAATVTNIQVLAYPPITVFTGSVPAVDIDAFRLIIPPKPVFPTTNVDDYNLTAAPAILSPGNPLFTYDAATNPANDNLLDTSDFSFEIPMSTTGISWTLRLETQDAVPVPIKTWTGFRDVGQTPWTSPAYSFVGLKDNLTLAVPATGTQDLNLKLIIQPAAYADPGYLPPPTEIIPTKVVIVDNTNPYFMNGTGTTVNPLTKAITLASGRPVITETENIMTFTLYTNEYLPTTISTVPGAGWQAAVKNSSGQDIVNTGVGTVGAVITNITPLDGDLIMGSRTVLMTVQFSNLTGDFDNVNSVLIIKAPWDKARNPGRYNNPIYPYNADVYYKDSSEGYIEFDILNAHPKITDITFTHRGVTGTAGYVGQTWNPQLTQGWVNAGSPNTFTLTATVTGGMYRALYSNVYADLSAFISGATAVLPDAVTAPAGTPNEIRVWTCTWNLPATTTITAALANAWADNQVLSIPITINTEETPNPPVHIEQKNINIIVDKGIPTITSTAVSLTANGNPQNFVFSIADPMPGSGINWSTASLTLNPNTGITISAMSPNGTWPVTIPANSNIKYIDATCTVSDYMGNSYTYHRYVNVLPVPVISSVTMTAVNSYGSSTTYMAPGNNITVNYALANPQRVKRITITLTSSGGVAITPNTQTFTTGFAASNSYTFNNVTAAAPNVPNDLIGKIITATITGVTDAYIAPTAPDIQEINLGGNGLTATLGVDMVAPNVSSTASTILANGSPVNLVFSITDPTPGSGINWSTATLTLNPNTGITIGTGSNGTWPVTIPANTSIKMITATVTVRDNVGNLTTYLRYLNVIPVPVISTISLTTVNPGGESNNYFVPGNNIRVNYNLTNPERVKRITITLTASGGVSITPNTQTITTGFGATNFYVFNGVTSTPSTALDGKVITATVTGWTDAFTAPDGPATQEITLTGNGSTGTINVDTKPVITSVKFYYNNVEVNTLLRNMNNVKIVATVSHATPLNINTFPMTITMGGVTGTFNLPAPTTSAASGVTTYTWTGVSFANLTWTPVTDYKIATFTFNCRTIYGYQADQRIHEMAVLSDRFQNAAYTDIYGVPPTRTPYSDIGRDPDGWFAPEHLLKVDFTFLSNIDQATPPIRANFDQIEDNITDNWTNPLGISTKTPISITLNQGTPNTITVYKYLAKWSVQPDVQSVWNAYDDGAPAPVYFKYRQYPTNIVPDEIDDSRGIKVDKKVPLYDKDQLWVAVKSTTPVSGDYQFINNGYYRPITLALQVNGSWATGNSVYLKYLAKDYVTGVGVTEVYNPANPAGWTITQVSQTPLSGGVVEKVIKITPNVPASISSATTMAVTLGKVEDLVGHVNYGLPINSTDVNWIISGPVLNFNFSANYATNLQMLEAYQVFGGNYLDNKSKPYVKAGQPLGVKLRLAPLARGVDVQNIVVSSVELNTRYITNVTGGTDSYVTLAEGTDIIGKYYYLNTSRLVNTSYTHGATIPLQYRINYTITFTDASTSSQVFTSNVISSSNPAQDITLAIVENNPPVLKDIWVWSESLGSAQEGYVVPNDTQGTVKLIFEEQAGYANPNIKPSVSITNLNVFVAGLSSPYTVPNSAITYYPTYS